jgi:hypothetical protein
LELGTKVKELTKFGTISDDDVCQYLFSLAGLVQDTADLYYDNWVKGPGKPIPARSPFCYATY